MKYIRTEEGKIFDVNYEPKAFKWDWDIKFIIDDNNLIVYDKRLKDRITNHGQILKQANTIKGLCDAYVITSKQGHIYDTYGDYDYELKEVLPQAKEEYPDEDWDLYGCILVDGIIKQVAKFNDEKGELELL